jgi:hypothetical protein
MQARQFFLCLTLVVASHLSGCAGLKAILVQFGWRF